MTNNRGSISLSLLIICFILVLLSQLLLVFCLKQQDYYFTFVRDYQLRFLCNSIFQKQKTKIWPAGEYLWYKGNLLPDNTPVTVMGKSVYSADGLINYLAVSAQTANQTSAVQQCKQLCLNISSNQQQFADRYVLASKTIKGTEYLPKDKQIYIQIQQEEVVMPKVDFLYGKCINNASKENIERDGLSGRFYYCKTEDFNLPENKDIYGSSLIANSRHINIGSNSKILERTVFISDSGNIRIGKNVLLQQTLLMAAGDVIIEEGCKINGLIIANRIILLGTSEFSTDVNVVAPLTSVAFINTV